MSRSPVRSTILVLQSLVALAAAGGAALGTAAYLDGRGHPEGFAELAGFLGAVFAAWCLVVLIAAVSAILRLRRDRPGAGVLTFITGVLGLLPAILLGASAAPPLLVGAVPFVALMVLGAMEVNGRQA